MIAFLIDADNFSSPAWIATPDAIGLMNGLNDRLRRDMTSTLKLGHPVSGHWGREPKNAWMSAIKR